MSAEPVGGGGDAPDAPSRGGEDRAAFWAPLLLTAALLSLLFSVPLLLVIFGRTLMDLAPDLLEGVQDAQSVGFRDLEIYARDADTDGPITEGEVTVRWDAGRKPPMEPRWYTGGEGSCSLSGDGRARISPPAEGYRSFSRATGMKVEIVAPGYTPFALHLKPDRPKHEKRLRSEEAWWVPKLGLIEFRLERRRGNLHGNEVLEMGMEGGSLFVHSARLVKMPEEENSPAQWSRFDKRTGRWEQKRWPTRTWLYQLKMQKRRGSVAEGEMLWRPEFERPKGIEHGKCLLVMRGRDRFTKEIIQQQSIGEFQCMGLQAFAVTEEAFWTAQSEGLFRYDRETGVLSPAASPPSEVVGQVVRLVPDPPWLWIGTKGYGVNRLHMETGEVEYFTR